MQHAGLARERLEVDVVAKGFESVASLIAGKIPEATGKSGIFGRK